MQQQCKTQYDEQKHEDILKIMVAATETERNIINNTYFYSCFDIFL